MPNNTRSNANLNRQIFKDYSGSLSDDEFLPSSTTRRMKKGIPSKTNQYESEPEDPCHGRPQSRFRRRQSRRRALGRSRRRSKKPTYRSRSRKRM